MIKDLEIVILFFYIVKKDNLFYNYVRWSRGFSGPDTNNAFVNTFFMMQIFINTHKACMMKEHSSKVAFRGEGVCIV